MNAPMQKAVADADSVEIAQLLGISTQDYLAKVAAYRSEPSLDPELDFDESAPEPPGGVKAIIEAVEVDEHLRSDGFEPRRAVVVVF